MKTIEKCYVIAAPIAKVWQALVDPALIAQWGAGPADMDDGAGTDFKLWGGDIFGKNVAVDHERKLVQDWYAGDWAEASIATFTLAEEAGGTRLDLRHSNVPEDAVEDIDSGWDMYYLGAIKRFLEM